MNFSLKILCVAGLVLSAMVCGLFVLIQILHAESVIFPAVALLSTGVIAFSLLTSARIFGVAAAFLSLVPVILLILGILAGHSEGSQAPVLVRILIALWALFYAFVGVCIASRTVRKIPVLTRNNCAGRAPTESS